jgi:Acetyltransferase (GNAT) domain
MITENIKTDNQFFEPYFLQHQGWVKFWGSVNPLPHTFFEFNVALEGFTLSAIVYQYPWYFGQKYWYIAKGGVLINSITGVTNNWQDIEPLELEKIFWELNIKIQDKAKVHDICYIKADWEEGLSQRLGFNNLDKWLIFYQKRFKLARYSHKIIQYLQTMTLDMNLIPKGIKFEIEDLDKFFDYSKPFWNSTNTNVKRYTKKSLTLGWDISTEKSDENFEAFWFVYSATKDRQAFVTQTKEYTRKLFDQEFSRIIILRNSDGEACCVWQGIIFGDTLIYLTGGNNQFSFDNYGQYLMHLVAVWMGYCESVEVYDLGGYDKTKGFGRFKENYKGQIRTFLGDIDIPINNFKFGLIDGSLRFVKKVKNLIKH